MAYGSWPERRPPPPKLWLGKLHLPAGLSHSGHKGGLNRRGAHGAGRGEASVRAEEGEDRIATLARANCRTAPEAQQFKQHDRARRHSQRARPDGGLPTVKGTIEMGASKSYFPEEAPRDAHELTWKAESLRMRRVTLVYACPTQAQLPLWNIVL